MTPFEVADLLTGFRGIDGDEGETGDDNPLAQTDMCILDFLSGTDVARGGRLGAALAMLGGYCPCEGRSLDSMMI